MRINRLYMQNFRNHKSSQAELGPVNIFLGRNNAGKSSVLAALEWGLTGRCGWTDRAGRGSADLVRHGEAGATVALEVEGLGPVVRTLGPAGLTVAGETGIQAAQAKLYHLLAADEMALGAVLNTGAFMAMAPGEQKNFLFTIFGLRWDLAAVEKALGDWAALMKYSPGLARELALRVRPLFPPGMTAGPQVLEAIEKRLRESRRAAKRDLQRLAAARGEIVIRYPDGLSTEDLPELTAQLAEVKAARDRLIARLADKKQAQDRRQALEKELSSTERRLKETREALAAQGPVSPQDLQPPDGRELQKLARQAQEAGSRLAGLESSLKALRQAAGALANSDGRCPLAPELVPCAMTGSLKSKLLGDLQSQGEKLAGEVQQASRELEAIGAQQSAAAEKHSRALRGAARAQEEARRAAGLEATAGELDRQAARLREELKEFDGLESEDLSPLQALDEKLARGLGLAEALKASLKKEQELASLSGTIDKSQQELAVLEILVGAFGSEGIKKHVLARVLQPFLERVNSRLQKLTGGRYQLEWAPDLSLQITSGGAPLPMRLLSSSEQFRVGIALQEAMAAFLGLKFLAIDGADVLDQENRDLLTGCLLDIMESGEYHQALVFSTLGEVAPASPGIEGFKMFWVEDGAIREIV